MSLDLIIIIIYKFIILSKYFKYYIHLVLLLNKEQGK